MFRTTHDEEPDETPIEATARQYARVGWSVTSRSPNRITMMRGDRTARITAAPDGTITVEGAELKPFEVTGRQQAWLLLLVMLIAAFAVAWSIGWLR